ncbi:hypothetical protein CLOP_g16729 [Closterium sp. NIES-67]|nr:hypothetical protein CLOP_g16729 [Closterium sp. NIES-67]
MALTPPVESSDAGQPQSAFETADSNGSEIDEPQLILRKMALMNLVAADGYHWLKYGEKVLSKIGDPVSVRR